MRKNITVFLMVFFGCQLIAFQNSYAQFDALRRKVEKKIEKAIDNTIEEKIKESTKETAKKEAKKEVDKETNKEKTSYPELKNRVEATFEWQYTTYKKKGNEVMKTKLVFGKKGETYISNIDGKSEMWMNFDYDDNACYMINPAQKTAMKMPMAQFQKMLSKTMDKSIDIDENEGKWIKTNEKEKISGYNCQKYIYENNKKEKMDIWITQDLKINLAGNYIFGQNLKNFQSKEQNTSADMPQGMAVKTVIYDKKGTNIEAEMVLTSYQAQADKKYFDRTGYTQNDMLEGFFKD